MVHRVDTACRHLGPGHAVKVKDTTGIVLIQTETLIFKLLITEDIKEKKTHNS